MSWVQHDLLAKARLFVDRAYEADRTSALFPFWSVLALEFIGRAALAHVHPALLADPQQGENLLHAFGFHTENPRSIPVKTVYVRCQTVVPRYTQREYEFCMSLTFLRNEELHSGNPAFEDLPTSQWLARFYRVCGILLEHQGLELSDLLPADEVETALRMLAVDEETLRSEVFEAIGRAQADFHSTDAEVRETLLAKAAVEARDIRSREGVVGTCPACTGPGVIEGEQVSVSETRLQDGVLYWETVILPTEFKCLVCKLTLSTYERLEVGSLGGQYTIEHWTDPVEYYGQQAIEAYMEPDYGND